MVTSATYTFGTLPSEQLITEAYERIGILPDFITAQQIAAAQRAANFLLSEWISKGLNLWTVKQGILSLIPYQNTYPLPQNTSDLLEVSFRTSQRLLGGTPFASSGIAANAFDGNPATACTQNAPNGFIGYQCNSTFPPLQMIGIQSNVTRTYFLSVESSPDNVIWTQMARLSSQSYPAGQIIWAALPVPPAGAYIRIRETGGATLAIQELYLNTALTDIPMTRLSRAEYMAIPVKNQTGRPTSFFVDRQLSLVVFLWPTPSVLSATLFYTCTRMLQDLGGLLNNAEVPSRFLPALAAGLAWKLAVKYAPNRANELKAEYDDAYNVAAREDTERVPLRIYGEYHPGGGMP